MIDLKFNSETRQTDIALSFIADAGVSKEGLTKAVIEEHLLNQGASLLRAATSRIAQGFDESKINAEATEAKAKIDAEATEKKSLTITSDVTVKLVPAVEPEGK